MSTHSVTSEEVRDLVAHFDKVEGAVLSALQAVQAKFGYVPDTALDVVASVCNVSRAEVYGVFTFYSDFRKVKPAKAVVKVCVAEACQSMGSRELVKELHAQGFDVHTGAQVGDVQVEQTFCLGNCALSPAAMVNGVPVGRAEAATLVKMAKEDAR